MKKVKIKDGKGKLVEVETISVAEQKLLTREELCARARPKSQGGTRPDRLSRDEWRTSQGAFYDDDRC